MEYCDSETTPLLHKEKEVNQTKSTTGKLSLELNQSVKYKLYFSRGLTAWGDRMWQFAIGLFFIKLLPGSFTLAAIHGIISSIVIILIAPLIGLWVERTQRLKQVQFSLFLQNGFTALGALCVVLHESQLLEENIKKWVCWVGLITFAIIAQIWSVGFSTCLEKDWILCIANNESQLTVLNAMLRRIDLICNTLAPTLVGFIMNVSLLWSALFLSGWNIFSAVVEYLLLRSIYNSVPNLKSEKESEKQKSKNFINCNAFVMFGQSFLLPGISFSLLFLTVLGFDSITIGYASEKGINETILSLVTVVGSVIGVIGTIFYPIFVKHFGVKNSALIGFICESIFLIACIGDTFKSLIPNETIGVILLLSGITAARFGLWIADMGVNQLIQTETTSPPLVSSAQTSLNILMELIKFIIVLLMPNVNQFYILIIISYSSVLLGAILFCTYVIKSKLNN